LWELYEGILRDKTKDAMNEIKRIFVTGDTHFSHDIGKVLKWDEGKQGDLLIVLGDFGLLWHGDPNNDEEKHWRAWYDDRPYEVAFIDGNHENHERIEALPEEGWCGGLVGRYSRNIVHLKRGQIYNICGKKILTIGGALSVDKVFRREHLSWWSGELLSKEEENYVLTKIEENPTVDFVLTHTIPNSVREYFKKENVTPANFELKAYDPVSNFLDEVYQKLNFSGWYAGHFHIEHHFSTDNRFHVLYNRVERLI